MSEENDKEEMNEPEENDITPDAMWRGDPVFSVSGQDFFKNMKQDRNRMRFETDSKVSKFMRASNYRKPFVMSYTDPDGNKQYKKVK